MSRSKTPDLRSQNLTPAFAPLALPCPSQAFRIKSASGTPLPPLVSMAEAWAPAWGMEIPLFPASPDAPQPHRTR